jgi:stringent starvation protein B
VSQEVAVPMAAVAGIFAKETGYGFAFNVPADPAASLAAATAPADEARSKPEGIGERPRARPSHLQVIK